MAQTIRIKMLDKEMEVALSENEITHSTMKSLFLLHPDTVVGLWYKIGEKTIGCK